MHTPDGLIQRLEQTAARYRMWEPGDRLVVGVSGGPDSVALLHLLHRLRETAGLSLVVAHLNHQLRGRQADEDARFVQNLARRWGLPAVVEGAPVGELARRRRLPVQEAAREARYAFFQRVAEGHGAARIALAHNADDQVETVLFRLLRGTGPRGLAGIPPVRGMVVRPLIEVPRADILRYCREHGLEYRHDPSNEDLRYRRNRIRLELLPYLETRYNPRLREALLRLAEIQRVEDSFLEGEAARLYGALAREAAAPGLEGGPAGVARVSLPRDGLLALHPAMQRRVMLRALARLGVPGKALGWGHIQRLLEGPFGRVHLPGPTVAEVAPEAFHLYRKGDREGAAAPGGPDFPVEVPGTYWLEGLQARLHLSREPGPATPGGVPGQLPPGAGGGGRGKAPAPGAAPWEAVLAWDAIKPPLRLRSRRPGDRFRPLGLGGTRKLQDFFVDQKVKREMRDAVPLLVDQAGIVCVVGYRIDERVRVAEDTRELLRVRLLPAAGGEPGAGAGGLAGNGGPGG